MSTLTWLHISDLHLRASDAYDSDVVLQALLRDIAGRIEQDNLDPDFIAVTGDIAFSGKPAEYKRARQFFDDLLQTTRLSNDRLFLVPGNHDVDRDLLSTGAKGIAASLTDRDRVNAVLNDPRDRKLMFARFKGYAAFVNDYLDENLPFGDDRYFYVRTLELAGKRIALIGLNSAWVSASEEDEAQGLLVGARQVRMALEQAKDADLKIALLHHPFDRLRQFDRGDSEALLTDNCDFVLHGHMHQVGLLQARGPDSNAFVIAAGACYKSWEHPNAYNFVRFDLGSDQGMVHLRMYSDQRGGFWTKDVVNYRNVPDGEYAFAVLDKILATPVSPRTGDTVPEGAKEEQITLGISETRSETRPIPDLDMWWNDRGYAANPFAWFSTESTEDDRCLSATGAESLSELFASWSVDPSILRHEKESIADEYEKLKNDILYGLGPHPTMDALISTKSNEPILFYAPEGGGKTFYLRWAAQRTIEQKIAQYIVKIPNLGSYVEDVGNITSDMIARGIYRRICEKLKVGDDVAPTQNVYQILDKCDSLLDLHLRDEQNLTRVEVFVDGVDQLFEEASSAKEHNDRVLRALADFCKTAAKRKGLLALRLFVPAQLEMPLEQRLGNHKRIQKCTVSWTAEHFNFVAIVERRLNSFWKGTKDVDLHLSRFFTDDVLQHDFTKWLQNQETLSPRCVMKMLNSLAQYAYTKVAPEDQLGVEIWNQFISLPGTSDICGPDTVYPLSRVHRRFSMWWGFIILIISTLSAVVCLSARARSVMPVALQSMADFTVQVVEYISSATDKIDAVLILAAVLGGGIFVFWRFAVWVVAERTKHDSPPDLHTTLDKVWQFIRRYLPGGL